MEAYLYSSSLREFLRARRILPWLILALLGMVLAMVWPKLSLTATPTEVYTTVSEMLTFHVLALTSAIFTSAIVSQEVEQKTIVYLLTRPIARWKLILFRYLASATVVAVLGIIGVALVSLGSLHNLSNKLFMQDIIAVLFGAFAYGALFLATSLIINRAMIVCLLFAFGWETVVPNMPGEMYRLSIFSHVTAIAQHPAPDDAARGLEFLKGALGANIITAGSAVVTMSVLTIILIAFCAFWFSSFEFVPREDTE